MKIAIAIDGLLRRDDSIFILELILNLYPNSEIYTIAHKRGAILGQIETRPIVSSYLSHRAKNLEVFKKNYWILPSAVKAIPIHSSIEKMIVISQGYIHGLNLPDHIEKYLYILDWNFINSSTVGWQKIFKSYVDDWREKSLRKFSKIAVSSEFLKNEIGLPNADVIPPTFRTEEYPFVRDEDHNFLFTHHLVLTYGLEKNLFLKLVKFLLSKGETVRVLGPDDELKNLINDPKLEFGGDHCEATVALYTHQAKVVWDLNNSFFPARSLGALCCGRPVVNLSNPISREFISEGVFYLQDWDSLSDFYQTINNEYMSFDRKKLRRLGLKWNERLFKSRISSFTNRSTH
jgi:hypothetical protein